MPNLQILILVGMMFIKDKHIEELKNLKILSI